MRFFKRAERPDSGPPSDEKIAAQMRSLARAFVDGVARNGRGRWVYSPEAKAPAVELQNGLFCFRQHKVARPIQVGSEHNLWNFYDYIMTGKTAPTSRSPRASGVHRTDK